MEHRSFGTTGRTVSVLGLGLAALGRPAYINLGHADDLVGHRSHPAELARHSHRVLDAARHAGINYYDTARSYGHAEEFLAAWLADRGLTSTDGFVGSKWGYEYVAQWQTDAAVHETKDHGLDTLDRQHRESTSLLGDHLTLYQIHSATSASAVLNDPDVLARLAEIRNSGTLIGLTTSGPDQARTIREAIAVEVDGVALFAAVQSTWNLLEPSAEPALADAGDAGLAVIVKEALANGRLTDHDPRIAARIRSSVPDHAVDAVAIAAAIQRPWSTVVLSGAATVEHLHSNLMSLDVSAEQLAGLPDISEPAEKYWHTRSELSWT